MRRSREKKERRSRSSFGRRRRPAADRFAILSPCRLAPLSLPLLFTPLSFLEARAPLSARNPNETHLPRGDLAPRLRLFDRDGDDVADAPALAALVDALRDFRAGVVRDLELRPVADHQSGVEKRGERENAGPFLPSHQKREERKKAKTFCFFFSAQNSKRKTKKNSI